jgi:hypothetical protein
MNLLLSPEQYKVLQESSEQFEKEIDSILTEGFGDVIGSPIKYIKLKNNSKKYQKALLKKALNDVDYAKKLEKGAKDLNAEQKEVLKQANKAKNTALSDKASAISGRMTDLATNDGLKQVEKLAKSKAKIAAAETTLKAASGQELKSLKLKISKLKGDAADASGELADYEKEGGDKEGGDKEGGKKDDTESTKTSSTEVSKGDKEQTPEQKAKNSKEGKIERYKKLLADTDDDEKKKDFQGKIDKLQKESWESFLDPNFERLVEAELATFETPLRDLKHNLNKRAQSFVNESVKDKFARLLNEKRSV